MHIYRRESALLRKNNKLKQLLGASLWSNVLSVCARARGRGYSTHLKTLCSHDRSRLILPLNCALFSVHEGND